MVSLWPLKYNPPGGPSPQVGNYYARKSCWGDFPPSGLHRQDGLSYLWVWNLQIWLAAGANLRLEGCPPGHNQKWLLVTYGRCSEIWGSHIWLPHATEGIWEYSNRHFWFFIPQNTSGLDQKALFITSGDHMMAVCGSQYLWVWNLYGNGSLWILWPICVIKCFYSTIMW